MVSGPILNSEDKEIGTSWVLYKLDMMVQTFNLSSLEAEAGESGIQSPPRLHSKFDASLGYMRLCLQKKKKKIFRKEPFSSSQTGARKSCRISLTSGEKRDKFSISFESL